MNEIVKHYKNSIDRIINEQPAADVVEVVRCKDCMHFCEIIGVTSYCSNRYGLNGKIHCDDFCSYGERKNEK